MKIKTRIELWHSISKLRGQTGEERQAILDEHKAKWVKVEDVLNWINQYEGLLGDLPKELSELKKCLS